MFQFVLGANFAVDLSRSSQGMFEYEYFFRPDSSAYSWRSTGAVRLIESPGAARAAGVDEKTSAVPVRKITPSSGRRVDGVQVTIQPWKRRDI